MFKFMKHKFPLVILAAVMAAPLLAQPSDDLATLELGTLQGTWRPVLLERKGAFVEDTFRPTARVVICKDRVSFRVEEKTFLDLHFRINPRRSPKQIDLTCKSGRVLRGIYLLTGNRLTMCWPLEADAPRPRIILDGPDRDHATFTLERVPE